MFRPASLFRARLVLALLLCLAPLHAGAAEPQPVIAHRVEASFDLDAHSVMLTDHLTLPPGLEKLNLGSGFEITGLQGAEGTDIDPAAAVVTVDDEAEPHQVIDLVALGAGGGGGIVLRYRGVFHQSTEEMTFSREKVGGEITATISDEGIYLSSMSGWLAWSEGAMAVYDLSFDTPAGFETVTQGERLRHETADGRLLTRWKAVHPSDGLTLVANRYFVHEEQLADGVTSYTFFLQDDARLRGVYMERTAAYLEMYEQMIGPYPYAKFATVENWFPTGYGMPSYTLLGGQVIRLPFIPYTSFGHEIAHNWWGNSVFVDVSEGNWCEGLTVYCADYQYKVQESEEAALRYRRRLLKDYAAYVKDPEQDFPLTQFLSRHSGASRAVGYGKSMMVFHMLDRLIGRENFEEGMRRVAAEHQFRKTTWSDFLAVFADLSGLDLDVFQEQWLTQTGAPHLVLSDVDFSADAVSFRIEQSEPPYQLDIPVVVTDAAGDHEEILHLDTVSGKFDLPAEGPTQVAVDPACHLFRRLDIEEIEPTLSQVLGDAAPTFIMDSPSPELKTAVNEFAGGFMDMPLFSMISNGTLPSDLPPEALHTNIVFNPGTELSGKYHVPGLTVVGSTAILEGKRYNLNQYDLVYAAQNPNYRSVTDLIIRCGSPDRLASLARRIGHYGKYSWLLLPTGSGPVLKGNWPTEQTPLTVAK